MELQQTSAKENSIDNVLIELKSKGYYVSKNHSFKDFHELAEILGKIILSTDVKISPDASANVQTANSLEWHQDSPEAKWIAWYCIHPGNFDSEPTQLLNISEFYECFEDVELKSLSDIKTTIRAANGSLQLKSVVSLDSNRKPILYYCPWLIQEDLNQENKDILSKLNRMIEKYSKNKIDHFWQKNDLLIVDNETFLHRRQELSHNSPRHLLRYWIKDEK